jgi:tRNA threonylcarbamoyladenosine biosynthesis protein TsaE
MRIIIKNLKEIGKEAKRLLSAFPEERIFAIDGPMGAGKTTIIKTICKLLGAKDTATSPTFTIVNEYRTKENKSLFHIDLYRIRKAEELYDIGLEEYLTGDSFCFIEWPGLALDFLPEKTLNVKISVGDSGERILDVSR